MNNQLVFSDYLIFILYLILVGSYGYWIYHKRKSKEHDSKGFFLAEGSLTWWAIGASLIASNISAEQFIGMSGNGFFVGVAVSAYEWIAALSLIIIAIWFIPIYLKNKIYTMPQFLKTRYNETVAMIMAILWLFHLCIRKPDFHFISRCRCYQRTTCQKKAISIICISS